jgi:hypothetical protein
MPVPNLKTRDVLHVVRFALYQLGRSITLDPRCFPSARTIIGIIHTKKQNKVEHVLVRGGNFVLENDMTFLVYLLRREEVQRHAIDEVGEVEDTESAQMHLVLGGSDDYEGHVDLILFQGKSCG